MKKLNKMCKYFHSTNLYTCPKCNKELRNYFQELKEKCSQVPIELKQSLLNFLKDGKNVGQAIEAVDPEKKYEHIVWTQIIADQIETNSFHHFNFQAK